MTYHVEVTPEIPQSTHHVSLTDGEKTVGLIICDSKGAADPFNISMAPNQRSSLRTKSGATKYEDLEEPWSATAQDDWSGGRAQEDHEDDTTRFFDSKRCQTAFKQIYNAPEEYYSEGYRDPVYTNYPGDVHWQPLRKGSISLQISDESMEINREVYVLLRRVGTPAAGLTVGIGSDGTEMLAEQEITTEDITDIVSEFHKVILSTELSTDGSTYLILSSSDGTKPDHWEIGVNGSGEPYYRIAPIQEGIRTRFFELNQLTFGIRQKPNGTPTLWMNGDIGTMKDDIDVYVDHATGLSYSSADIIDGKLYTGRYYTADDQTYRDIPDGHYILMEQNSYQDYHGLYRIVDRPDDGIIDISKSWETDQWKGARVGLIYGKGIEGQVSVWRTITGNTANTLTVDHAWDVMPDKDTTYVITDTPLWTQIETDLLTAAVTDVEVVHGTAYICQGDYVPYVVMYWNSLKSQWIFTTDRYRTTIIEEEETEEEESEIYEEVIHTEELCASYIKSIRDEDGMLIYRARNDAVSYEIIREDVENPGAGEPDHTYRVISGRVRNQVVDRALVIDRALNMDPPDEETNLDYVWQKQVQAAGTVMLDCEYPSIDGTQTRSGAYADFYYPDVDMRQYKIVIGIMNGNGTMTVKLQQSSDPYSWADVKSFTCGCAGVFYMHAHCQHRYRRIAITVEGCSVKNVVISALSGEQVTPIFTDAVVLRDSYGKITSLAEYTQPTNTNYKTLWINREGMIQTITGSGNLDTINLEELHAAMEEHNGITAIVHNSYYYVRFMRGGIQRYYNQQMDSVGPDRDTGLPADRQGEISALLAYPGKYFCAVDAGDEGYSSVLMNNNSGWHEIYRAPNKGERITALAYQAISGDRPDRLWISVGDDIVWLVMPSNTLRAYYDPQSEYTHESVLISSWYSIGMVDVIKQWGSMNVMAENLTEGVCWIEADYQTDQDPQWHRMAADYIESPTQEIKFKDKFGISAKRLRYRLRLLTTDKTKCPFVKAVVLKTVVKVQTKYNLGMSCRNVMNDVNLCGEVEDISPWKRLEILMDWADNATALKLRCFTDPFDDRIVFLDPPQVSNLREKNRPGMLLTISLNEI